MPAEEDDQESLCSVPPVQATHLDGHGDNARGGSGGGAGGGGGGGGGGGNPVDLDILGDQSPPSAAPVPPLVQPGATFEEAEGQILEKIHEEDKAREIFLEKRCLEMVREERNNGPEREVDRMHDNYAKRAKSVATLHKDLETEANDQFKQYAAVRRTHNAAKTCLDSANTKLHSMAPPPPAHGKPIAASLEQFELEYKAEVENEDQARNEKAEALCTEQLHDPDPSKKSIKKADVWKQANEQVNEHKQLREAALKLKKAKEEFMKEARLVPLVPLEQ